ncbi:hypothetical protein GOP47_0005405 [Adiantum capillus-veneris]|uniref:Pentatricopeptide repeat-containing protein n=1 Tax=Adiantum capillus-veneris TaxID=13818 RepID=A0A9D4V5Y4_ADICA|nr:hypothetical protein GOP47_0005405 [Adiantum capillus-veneris]
MLITASETLSHVELPAIEDWLRSLDHCREKKDLPSTRRVCARIHGNGLQTLEVLGNYLVPTFAECGSIQDAFQVFQKLEDHNEQSWTSLIQVTAEYGDCGDGFHLLQSMQDNGVAPSRFGGR